LSNGGEGETYVASHRQREKLLARERVDLLIGRDSRLLELTVAAWGTDFPVGIALDAGSSTALATQPTITTGWVVVTRSKPARGANRRVKNDLGDATLLVDLLRLGRLPEAWVAPLEVRCMRPSGRNG
jgi:hypothetical protein